MEPVNRPGQKPLADASAPGDRLAGRVALVLGGAQGIGAATCEVFASQGAQVMIADVATEPGTALAERLGRAGRDVVFCEVDVTSAELLAAAVGECVLRWGALHSLVHSVYTSHRAPAIDLAPEDWHHTLDVGLTSAYLAARSSLPAIVASGGGSLTFISSIEATFGHPSEPAYAAAKAGLCGLARQLAVDYGPRGVRANCILPGQVLVDRNRPRLMGEPGLLERRAACFPLQRVADPLDIARVALFLASDDAAFVSGVSLPVDGGLSAYAATAVAESVYQRFGTHAS